MKTVRLTIDGKKLEVAEGTTVLEAARRLGIEIPTLCHVEGLEPSASCFLCAVEIEGRSALAPSCAMPALEGMVVRTQSGEIEATRRMALELLISDHAGECVAPCQATCPAGLDIPGFIYPLARGQTREAMEVIYKRLALPGSLGRVCPRLCEDKCRRCGVDEGLGIGSLHRHAPDCDLDADEPYLPSKAESSGKKVAIVGAGPAGLAAAFFLEQRGHPSTLFDAHPEPGGMLRYGIPEYRLPREALDAEVEVVRRLGARFVMNSRWGADFSLSELCERFDAVFVAIGAQQCRNLGCDGEEQALSGLEFLERVSKGRAPAIGERVVVIGGGNTAMDACRSAVRLGARQVQVLYRRERRDMPCLLEEVEGAEAEGVSIEFLVAPKRLEKRQGAGLRLTCLRMTPGEPDASGRRRPVPVAGSEFELEVDTVITAVGQSVAIELARSDGLEVNAWGIAADARTLATNLPGVFAGGDAVSGPDLAVRAVAAGRLAASSIDQYLSGQPLVGDPEITNVQLQPVDEDELAAMFRNIEQAPRTRGAQIDRERRRTTFDEIDCGLDDARAKVEAQRCLSCGCQRAESCEMRFLASRYGADPARFRGERRRFDRDLSHPTISYEPGKCILCNACVQVTEEAGEECGLALVGRGFETRMAVPFDRSIEEGVTRSVERVVEVCPTGALAMRTERACDTCVFFRGIVGCGVADG